ncbi:MAG: radical SAM protein, partial [bacterium]|nr:radical SAM protein [bacterium]
LDPRYIKYSFVKELSYIEKMADSFHFSFQSGSNTILKAMKRGSKVEEYETILGYFRDFFPGANMGADILLGFPGETDREYCDTRDFVSISQLNYVHIFPYSPRDGTKAALLEPMPANVVRKRVTELKEINRNKRLMYRERFIGETLEGILIEEDPNYSLVLTKNFLSVRIPPVEGYKKKKVKVKVTRVVNDNISEGVLLKG